MSLRSSNSHFWRKIFLRSSTRALGNIRDSSENSGHSLWCRKWVSIMAPIATASSRFRKATTAEMASLGRVAQTLLIPE